MLHGRCRVPRASRLARCGCLPFDALMEQSACLHHSGPHQRFLARSTHRESLPESVHFTGSCEMVVSRLSSFPHILRKVLLLIIFFPSSLMAVCLFVCFFLKYIRKCIRKAGFIISYSLLLVANFLGKKKKTLVPSLLPAMATDHIFLGHYKVFLLFVLKERGV